MLSMYYDDVMERRHRQAAPATPVTIRIDPSVLEQAAKAAGVYDPAAPPSRLAADVMYATAGLTPPPRLAGASGGAAPKRAGRTWENEIVAYANEHGFQWDKAPLRGARDLLDVTGCLPAGWLIGAKALANGTRLDQRISDALDQAHRAVENLAKPGPGVVSVNADDVIPWQIMQRRGHPVGQAYAVTEYDWMLRLCELRRDAWGAR